MFTGILIRAFICLTLLGIVPLAGAPASDPEPEDELKAAIVLSFLRYAEWPQSPGSGGFITIGISGRSSVAEVLRRTVQGKSIGNRTVRLVELKPVPNPECCQIIYFATENRSELRDALTAAHGARVLTIGHTKGFLELGGAVNILTVDGHMSFEVSLDELERSGIEISSKLLRFGQIRGNRKAGRS